MLYGKPDAIIGRLSEWADLFIQTLESSYSGMWQKEMSKGFVA
jgi:hypothetical protein